jgi:deoxyribonuclease-4
MRLNFNTPTGLHLRLQNNLTELVEEAAELELSCIQFFLVEQAEHQYIPLTTKDKKIFLAARNDFLKNAFIHSSYWINPASAKEDVFNVSRILLRKELKIAHSLNIQHLVLHGGSAKGHPVTPEDPQAKKLGLENLARMLNLVLKAENDVTILLENTAHGCRTIGNNLEDFVYLRTFLDFPEKIGFCLDTAHAFSYGYDISALDNFIPILESTMGINNIKLIHLNDSAYPLGSQQDKHAVPGSGLIGKSALLPFVKNPVFSTIPKIIEPPICEKDAMRAIMADLTSW